MVIVCILFSTEAFLTLIGGGCRSRPDLPLDSLAYNTSLGFGKLLDLGGELLHDGEEVLDADAWLGAGSVPEGEHAVNFLSRVLSEGLSGHTTSVQVLSHLVDEVLELGSVEEAIGIGVSGAEGSGELGHSLGLGLLSLPRLLFFGELGLLIVIEAVSPGKSLLSEEVGVDHRVTI